MCGRISLGIETPDLEEFFKAKATRVMPPRFNLAPTQDVAVIRSWEPGRSIEWLRWGLIPSWAKDASFGAKTINARAETVREKPSFRSAFKARRCVVLADGFYEWNRHGKTKSPFRIRRKDGAPMAFAGLWESWQPKAAAEPVLTCTVITCPPNQTMQPIHDRMPVILAQNAIPKWMAPTAPGTEAGLASLLVPAPKDDLEAYRVSTLVNSVRNDTPACIAPYEPAQGSLF